MTVKHKTCKKRSYLSEAREAMDDFADKVADKVIHELKEFKKKEKKPKVHRKVVHKNKKR